MKPCSRHDYGVPGTLAGLGFARGRPCPQSQTKNRPDWPVRPKKYKEVVFFFFEF